MKKDHDTPMDTHKDLFFTRNASGVALVEFFWGLGFPVIMESTFLQIFLKNMGASDFLIGLVPSILIFGISIMPLASSYLTRSHEKKKKTVILLHVVSSCSTMGFGIFLFLVRDKALILPVFFLSYGIFSLCIGLTFPVWLNFLVKIFSENKNVKGLSIMMIAQNTAKILSSLLILKMVEAFALSLRSAAFVFLVSGLMFLAGSLCFLLTKELPEQTGPSGHEKSLFTHTRATLREMLGNKNLIWFIIADLDTVVVLTVISFYANYATQYHGIKNAIAAGLFVTFLYTGAILANVVLGTFGFMSLKNKFLLTKGVTIVLLMVLIFFPSLPGFLCASLLLGVARGTRSIIYSPCIKRFSNRSDSTGFFALAPLITIVFGSGFPALFGRSLDLLSQTGDTAYRIMFGVSIMMTVIFLIFGLMVNFDKKIEITP